MARQAQSILLYRFLSFRKPTRKLRAYQQERQIFLHNQFHFSSPAAFNDPFDGKPHFLVRHRTADEYRAYFRRIVSLHPATQGTTLRQRRDMAERFALEAFANPDKLIDAKKLVIETALGAISICCFAKSYRHVLMWSHYASGHAGYCIGVRFSAKVDNKWFPDEVVYSKEYPTIDILEDHQANPQAMSELTNALLYRKAPAWRYERECRIVRTFPSGLQEMLPGSVECVILGARIGDKDRAALLQIVEKSGSNLKVFQAELASGSFSIKRRRLLETPLSAPRVERPTIKGTEELFV
jgi:hypothetical protein